MLPRFARILLIPALVVTVSGGLVATQAEAVTPKVITAQSVKSKAIVLKAGPKLRAHSGFKTKTLGAIKGPNGEWGFCINPGKGAPNGTWTADAVKAIKDPTVRAQATWLVNSQPNAIGTKTLEPAVDAALLRIIDADFRSDWKTSYTGQLKGTGVVARADWLLNDTKLHAGPVTIKTTLTKKPGKNGAGSIRAAVTMNGHPAVDVPLRWTVTGAKTSGTSKTGKDGTAVLEVTRKGLAPVTWTVNVTTADWRRANYSTPTTSSRQHLMRGGLTVTTKASGSYTTAAVTQDCGTQCDGRPPMTLTATAGTKAVQWRAVSGTKVIGALSLKAGKSGTAKFTGTDGQHLLIQYRVKGGKWVTAQAFDVICPPWPAVELKCACDGALTVTLTPTGGRYYSATVGSKTVDLTGATAVKTALKSGDSAGISVTAYSDAARTKAIGTHAYGTWTQG